MDQKEVTDLKRFFRIIFWAIGPRKMIKPFLYNKHVNKLTFKCIILLEHSTIATIPHTTN